MVHGARVTRRCASHKEGTKQEHEHGASPVHGIHLPAEKLA